MMTGRKIIITLCCVAMLKNPANYLSAQSNSNANLEEAKKKIASSNENYFQAFTKKDVSKFTTLYALDCWIMAPNVPTPCGPDAAGDYFQMAYNKIGIRNGKIISIDIYGISNDIVAEIGFWRIYNAGNIAVDDGKFIVLWKKTAEGWKRWRDSFSSNRVTN